LPGFFDIWAFLSKKSSTRNINFSKLFIASFPASHFQACFVVFISSFLFSDLKSELQYSKKQEMNLKP
jgi:hypothetical protein